MRSLTLTAALSVRAITIGPPVERESLQRSGSAARSSTMLGRVALALGGVGRDQLELDLAGRAVDERVEPVTSAPPSWPTRPSTMPRCRLQTRSGCCSARARNGQWAKAMTAPAVEVDHLGVEAQAGLLGDQGVEGVGAVGPLPAVGPALLAAGVDQLVGGEARGVGGRQQRSGPGWAGATARARATGRRRPASSGAEAGPPRPGTQVATSSRPDLAHALEVGSHGVDVQARARRRSSAVDSGIGERASSR